MLHMPLNPTWPDVVARLLLTVLAGVLLGLNREARGHAAGLRTTILVGLAAAVAMIHANLLLGISGKEAGSFSTMDVLRFPLGVLTGVGFIGGGAILKRGDLITGVTTAATLWIMTAIGLAFGGGQYLLGAAATVLSLAVLLVLKWIDLRIPREHFALLTLSNAGESPPDLDAMIRPLGYRARLAGLDRRADGKPLVLFHIRWSRADIAPPPTDLLTLVGRSYTVEKLDLIRDPAH
jgi:putative Mg2+ transporter-C (MgtC) family protein